MKFFALMSFLAVFAMNQATVSAQELTFATLNWEPYIGQKLEDEGFVAEIVRAAFQRSGYDKVTFLFYPWARTLKASQAGLVDGYLPEYYASSIEAHHLFSAPFPGGPLVFLKLKAKDIPYHSLPDLKPYKIGVVRGYVNTREFDMADFLNKEEVANDLQNLKKLLAGRVDLIVIDKYVGDHLLDTRLPGRKQNTDFLDPPLGVNDLYVCFSKKKNYAETLRNDFNAGLRQIREDGTLMQIMNKKGF